MEGAIPPVRAAIFRSLRAGEGRLQSFTASVRSSSTPALAARPQRWTAGGHRLYDESVFDRLDSIARLKAEGKSLKEMRELLTDG